MKDILEKLLIAVSVIWINITENFHMQAVKRVGIILAFLGSLLVAVILFAQALNWINSFPEARAPSTMEEVSAIVRNYGLVIAGFVGFCIAILRLMYVNRQHRLDKRSELFDRFQRSSAMLDSDNTALRQAGIHVLAEIAREEPSEFYDRVINMLSSFLRIASVDQLDMANNSGIKVGIDTAQKQNWPTTRADVAEALSSISNLRTILPKGVKIGHTIDIRPDLSGLFVAGYEIHDIDFFNCILRGAVFADARMTDVSFEDCELSDAIFDRAEMHDCIFVDTTATFLSFRWAAFHSGIFSVADIGAIDAANCLAFDLEFEPTIQKILVDPLGQPRSDEVRFPAFEGVEQYQIAREVTIESEIIATQKRESKKNRDRLQNYDSA